jgi:hypothetical protein
MRQAQSTELSVDYVARLHCVAITSGPHRTTTVSECLKSSEASADESDAPSWNRTQTKLGPLTERGLLIGKRQPYGTAQRSDAHAERQVTQELPSWTHGFIRMGLLEDRAVRQAQGLCVLIRSRFVAPKK